MASSAALDDTRGLIDAWRGGNLAARDRLFAIFYPDLRRIAAAMLRRERGLSLSTRDLIHDTVARMVRLERIDWEDRAHFLALASRMMRQALIDHVRALRRHKRAHQRVTLVTGVADQPDAEVEHLNDALERLAAIEPERADIVEMRYFGGMEIADIATVLAVSESTVKRRWMAARLWLADAMAEQRI